MTGASAGDQVSPHLVWSLLQATQIAIRTPLLVVGGIQMTCSTSLSSILKYFIGGNRDRLPAKRHVLPGMMHQEFGNIKEIVSIRILEFSWLLLFSTQGSVPLHMARAEGSHTAKSHSPFQKSPHSMTVSLRIKWSHPLAKFGKTLEDHPSFRPTELPEASLSYFLLFSYS